MRRCAVFGFTKVVERPSAGAVCGLLFVGVL